jgi:hypothetical protein
VSEDQLQELVGHGWSWEQSWGFVQDIDPEQSFSSEYSDRSYKVWQPVISIHLLEDLLIIIFFCK